MNLNRRSFVIAVAGLPFLVRAAEKLKIGMIGSGKVGSAIGGPDQGQDSHRHL